MSSVSRLEAGRRESVSSGEGEFSHAKEASVLSDSSFEAATTKTTGSSSGVSSDLSDSDNDVSSDQSDPGTQSPSQVREYFYLLSVHCAMSVVVMSICVIFYFVPVNFSVKVAQ